MPSGDSYSLIEGDFGNFTIRRVSYQDRPRVLQHMQEYFMKDEMACKALEITNDINRIREFFMVLETVLDDNISFLVEDKETKEIAAVRIIHRLLKTVDKFAKLGLKTREVCLFLELFRRLNEEAKIFERFGVTEYAELFSVSTATKYRNQGLAKELYRRSLLFLKAEGFKLTKVFLSSPYTKSSTKSLGFQELCSLSFEDAKDGQGGYVMFSLSQNWLQVWSFALGFISFKKRF